MQITKQTRPYRHEVPEELKWKVEDLFADSNAWKAALVQAENSLAAFDQYKGKLATSSSVLLECLQAQEALLESIVLISTYASLKQSEDGTNPENQANSSLFAAFNAKAAGTMSFIQSEILEMPEELIAQFLKEEQKLAVYSRNIQKILAAKKYALSSETEKVLASLGQIHASPYLVYQSSKLADMSFASIEDNNGAELPVSFALFEDVYEFSPDPEIRRNAYKSFTDTLASYNNTIAAAYSTEVKKQVTLANIRGYASVTDMLLESQEVTTEMYHNQLSVIFNELAPHMRKFASLKKEQLGLEKMLFCDLKAPLDHEFNPETTFEEASDIILEALKVMGPEYSEIMKKALTERWVDIADNVGKSTGAFCSSPYGSHPFILITWGNTMRSAFMLAHELGHAGHFYLANKNQRIVNTRPSTYFIEAPSTMNEMLLADYLLAKTNDNRMRRWTILQLLGTYYHNFVTHLLEGEFQRRVYKLAEEGTPLTARVFNEVKGNVLKEFWGDSVEITEQDYLTWMRQPHYYMGLYPYTYSAGLTASTAVAASIRENGQETVDKWLDVLRAGGTKTPLELLKYAGVDMSNPNAIKQAVAYVGTLVDELTDSFA
ncbi:MULTISPECIES: oligoendopeptidase F [unclassified Niallia]|uniref:oligoendopeptidase F n=1 Tax=unclassified Niallia TaxID=2837522 RepID=UPI001ED9E1A9|nr:MULTISPECIES: oligoendopeptidase F [unclassified Niallia]MDL0434853.1 oligoendopeptidase F [Niallia sp. SS-2023]UPO89328.1 oligoendopeptidase F [Niallia sp. Man26]